MQEEWPGRDPEDLTRGPREESPSHSCPEPEAGVSELVSVSGWSGFLVVPCQPLHFPFLQV